MKKYIKPSLVVENLELNEVIMASTAESGQGLIKDWNDIFNNDINL